MRLKKGFTLAEILIVLMVIGAIATMTIPSLMKGVQDAQFKTAYKKAFNAVVNIAAMENVAGNLPATTDNSAVKSMYTSLKNSLSVKDYATPATGLNTGTKLDFSNIYETDTDEALKNYTDVSPWLTTEDNISYAVMTMDKYKSFTGVSVPVKDENGVCTLNGETVECPSTACSDKAQVNVDYTKACVVVVVDVNGVASSPNLLEPQVSSKTFSASTKLDSLTGDILPIFIANNGATAGSKKTTATGRIVADLK